MGLIALGHLVRSFSQRSLTSTALCPLLTKKPKYLASRHARASKLYEMDLLVMAFSTSGSQEMHLTTVEATRNYLESNSNPKSIPPVVNIIPLKGGITNFTYRLTFDGPQEFLKDLHRRTAIFKYSANYAAATRDVPFDRRRQTYEAESMSILPSLLSKEFGEEAVSSIKIPELFLHDPNDGVLIMEDVAPTVFADGQAGFPRGIEFRPLTKLCRFVENGAPEIEYSILEQIGTKLGKYLFYLHALDKKAVPPEENPIRSMFSDFEVSRKLCVQTNFRDFMRCADKCGVEFEPSVREEVQGILDGISELVLNSLDTFIMGDFWPGNVITAIARAEGETPCLHSLALIDWEFATYGPSFIDLAHFAAEAWLANNFISSSFIGLQRLVAALFKSYREQGGIIDMKNVIYYVGGHATCFMDFAPWTEDLQEKKVVTEKVIKLMLLAKGESWEELKKDELLKMLF